MERRLEEKWPASDGDRGGGGGRGREDFSLICYLIALSLIYCMLSCRLCIFRALFYRHSGLWHTVVLKVK